MINAYEAAAMVAESNGAHETAAWLRSERQRVARLTEAARELVETIEPILADYGFIYVGKIQKMKRALSIV